MSDQHNPPAIRATLEPERPAPPQAGRARPKPLRALAGRQELLVLGLLLLAGIVLSLRSENFLQPTNLLNLARGVSWFAISALGVSMVILIGGIDLSVGAVMALAGLVCALALQAGTPLPLAIGAGLLSGTGVGMANGLLVGQLNLPPFIVTLGTMGLARGLALGLTGGAPVRELPASFRMLGQGDLRLAGVTLPLPLLAMVTMALLVSLLLHQTVLGRYIYTLGRDEQALRVAGVATTRIKITVYTFSGLLAACGGIIMTAWLGVAAPTAAEGYELDIIAAAVIGGTSLFGGEGSVLGVVLGTLLMLTVRNGMVMLGLPAYWQLSTIGAMILAVVLIDYLRRRRLTHG
ncbi:MAG: ABC transporter permease [Chloroflexi bacterium OHK40]